MFLNKHRDGLNGQNKLKIVRKSEFYIYKNLLVTIKLRIINLCQIILKLVTKSDKSL